MTKPPKPRAESNSRPEFSGFMDLALEEARAAQARGEVPIGAVLVKDGEVIAADGNRTLELDDPTAHAEMLVIRAGGAALGSQRLSGCDLYVTLEPCAMCAGALAHARIRRLYFGAADPKGGAVEAGPQLYRWPTIHHRPEIYSGFCEADSAALLRGFFEARR